MAVYSRYETEETAKIIADTFEYHHKTGDLIRIKAGKTWQSLIGKPVRTLLRCKSGNIYYMAYVNRRLYLAHRMCWLLHFGEWPDGLIDHSNGNGRDNRISNLSVVNDLVNAKNKKLRSNETGVTGVRLTGSIYKPWAARICVNGVSIYLGSYRSLEDAACARRNAEREHGFHKNHGKPR